MFERDTGRCDRFPYVDMRNSVVVKLFSNIRRENIANTTAEMMSSHFSRNSSPYYHNDSSFFQYAGALTTEDWKTDAEETIEAVILFQDGKRKVNQMLKTVRRNFEGMINKKSKRQA